MPKDFVHKGLNYTNKNKTMSTDLYGIRVLEKKDQELKIKVFLTYYDMDYIPNSKAFFLMVLWEKAAMDEEGLLAQEISDEQIFNEDYMDEHAPKYISKVKETAALNYPVKNLSSYSTFYYEREGQWKDEDLLAQKDFVITMTDAKWIEELKEGMSWGTTAHEL